MPASCVARDTMVDSTVSRSSVELTAWPTSPNALSSPTDRVSSRGTRLQLLEQPDVLDRDHGLIGKGLEQRDLRVGERSGFGPADARLRQSRVLREQRYGQNCCENPRRLQGSPPNTRGPSSTSGIATTLHVRIARAAAVSRLGSSRIECGAWPRPLPDSTFTSAAKWINSPSNVKTFAELALAQLQCGLSRSYRTLAARRSATG